MCGVDYDGISLQPRFYFLNSYDLVLMISLLLWKFPLFMNCFVLVLDNIKELNNKIIELN